MLLSRKLPISAAVLAISAILFTSIIGIYAGTQSLNQSVANTLSAIVDGRRDQIELYLQAIENDLKTISNQKDTITAINRFNSTWSTLGDNPLSELQTAYITSNPHPIGEKQNLVSGGSGPYHYTHSEFHPGFLEIQQIQGYYDVFLIDLNGNIVYSVFKELDYATNLLSGQWSDTDLAKVFKEVKAANNPSKIAFTDFSPYGPSNDAPASFMGKGIFDGETLVGVLAYQMPISSIKSILNNRTGLGEDGETVLMNKQGYFVIDSDFTEQNDVLKTKIESNLLAETNHDITKFGDLTGYRNMDAVAAFTHVNFDGVDWAIASIKNRDVAFAGISDMTNTILVVSALFLLAAIVASIYFARTITKPIDQIVIMMDRLKNGDTDISFGSNSRSDEIGKMITSVEVFRDAAIEKASLQQETEAERAQSEGERRVRDREKAASAAEIENAINQLRLGLDALAAGDLTVRIDEEFGQGLDSLRASYNSAIEQLEELVLQVTNSVDAIHTKADEMILATDQLSSRTETQAKSLQEASASVEEISVTVKQSANDANSSSTKANEAKKDTENSRDIVENAIATMGRIEDDSNKISSIIGVIDEISFQTNLLALNAGVEAARAGDAGKGFAVVAQEVRELAQRSAVAAQDINQLISNSKTEVEQGVKNVAATGEALKTIYEHVDEISDFISSIAVTTSQQSIGLEECNRSVTALDASTQQNAAMAEETTAVTHQLAQDARELAQMVKRFKTLETSNRHDREAA